MPWHVSHITEHSVSWFQTILAMHNAFALLRMLSFHASLSPDHKRKLQWCLYVGRWVLICLGGSQFQGSDCCLKYFLGNLQLVCDPPSRDEHCKRLIQGAAMWQERRLNQRPCNPTHYSNGAFNHSAMLPKLKLLNQLTMCLKGMNLLIIGANSFIEHKFSKYCSGKRLLLVHHILHLRNCWKKHLKQDLLLSQASFLSLISKHQLVAVDEEMISQHFIFVIGKLFCWFKFLILIYQFILVSMLLGKIKLIF